MWTFEQWRNDQDRLALSGRAEGTVTGHLNRRPVVSFSLANGDRITFTARDADRDDYRDGRKVEVRYRLDQPGEAVIDRPRARLARTALLGSLAIAVMVFGASMAWYARRRGLESGPAV